MYSIQFTINNTLFDYHLSECQVWTVDIMRHIDILIVLAHQRALDMKALQIRRCHHDNIRLHLHHQDNQLVFTNIVRLKPLALHLKHLVLWVAGNIVNDDIRLFKKRLYKYFENIYKIRFSLNKRQAASHNL